MIVQAVVHGEEVNVVGVGDGDGGLWGAVAMKKLALTDKGKGWAGVTIDDRRLLALAEKFVSSTRWPRAVRGRGHCDPATVGTTSSRSIRASPPGCTCATGAGVNLPRAVVELARGKRPPSPKPYDVGKMFVRISLDQIVDMSDFEPR